MDKEEDKPMVEKKDQKTEKVIIEEVLRLFSQEEVKSIVKEFVRAYIRGQITLKLAMPDIVENNPYLSTLPSKDLIKYVDVVNQRTFIKNTICIVAGTKNSTKEEYEKAITDLFEIILIMRLTDSMQGIFLITDVDNRLNVLERNLNDISNKQEKSDILIRKTIDYIERSDPYRERKQ